MHCRKLVLYCLAMMVLGTVAGRLQAELYLPRAGETPPPHAQEYAATARWDSSIAGVPATVTYSFVTSNSVDYDETAIGGGMGTITPLANFMPSGYLAEIEAAFDAWSAVTNITFTEIADSGNDYLLLQDPSNADIRIGGHAFDGASGTLAHAVTATFDTTPLDTIAFA